MCEVYSVVAIYDSHSQAEKAAKRLQKRSGFDMKNMSILGDVKTGRVLLIYDGPRAFPFKRVTYRRVRGSSTRIPTAA
jgi:hypothetical protein